ncbi:MAG TPA: cytochrome c oxidase accessory protein CcoG [Gammaproteobacteria bacterium]|nr:cytochrome c oxidase accessory protein CcoG [Gammaproteobacteria bacterium]
MIPAPQSDVVIPIYPRSVKGRFRNIKYVILILAYLVYYGLPWLPWPREVGPDQAILFDIIARKYYLFGLVVQPEQIFWLAGFLIIAAMLLFFITGIGGRVFCGYFCFQTLWTDVFFRLEKWIQGERPARIKLDKAPWNAVKIRKKVTTWTAWLLVAFWTAISFSLYWGNAGELLLRFFTGDAPSAMYVTTAILTFTTFTMAGMAREQTCTHMCPYSRFQSAMFDKNTRIVAYDSLRGEGKKGRAKVTKTLKTPEQRSDEGIGDCIDCGYCVQVCPTGIDIRDGLQILCIHCALCIDACDTVMDRMGWEKNLIRYSSETEDEGNKLKWFTLKNVGYGLGLVIATGVLVWSVLTKPVLETSVRQIRQPLFVTLSDGSVQNSYEIKLSNQTVHPQTWQLDLSGIEAQLDTGKIETIRLEPLKHLRVFVKLKQSPDTHLPGKVQDFFFVVQPLAQDAESDIQPVEISARFYRP